MNRPPPPAELVARTAELVRVLGARNAALALDLGIPTVRAIAQGKTVSRGSIAIAQRSLAEIDEGPRR